MSPHRTPRPPGSRREDLIALERFYIRALLMQRAYEKATSDWAAKVIKRVPVEDLIGLSLERDSYYNLWIGCLKVTLEGWRERLGCADPVIDELLDSELTPLLADFRNSVFHYDPDYPSAPFNYAGEEALEWLESLMAGLASFLEGELGQDSQLKHVL